MPVEPGGTSAINISITAGTDITVFVDCGNNYIEERFFEEAVDLQTDPLPFNCNYQSVGTYIVEVILANRRSYVTATFNQEVDQVIDSLNITWNHTELNKETCVKVSAIAGTRITVFWITDDIYAFENYAETVADLQELCYQYTTKGFYDTELRVSNSLSYVSRNLMIAVVDRLQGVTFDVPKAQEDTQPVNFVRTATSGSHATTEVDFGDGKLQILYKETMSTTDTFNYTYQQVGAYHWVAMCTNYLDTIVKTGVIYIQHPIQNLVISTKDPKIYGGDLRVNFSLTQGTNVSCDITLTTIEDNPSTTSIDTKTNFFYNNNDTTGYVLIPDTNYTTKNYTITFNCSNQVSNAQVSTTVGVDKIIQGTRLNFTGAQSPYGRLRDNHSFMVQTSDGSRYFYSIDWGDDENTDTKGTGTDIEGSALSVTQSHNYVKAGYFIVTLFVWNYVSSETHAIEVGIEEPIDDNFVMDIEKNATYTNTDVLIQLNWTGPVSDPDLTSVFLTSNFRHDAQISEQWLNFSTIYIIPHAFPYYTYYNVTLHVKNNITSQDLSYIIRVGEEIKGLHIEFPSNPYNKRTSPPSYESEFSEDLALLFFGVNQGSNVQYNISFGDGNSKVVNRTNTMWALLDLQNISISYLNPGDFYATVRAINNLTNASFEATTEWHVNVEHPVPTLTMDYIPPQNINGTNPAEIILKKNSIENVPTDASCEFAYPDTSTEVVSMDDWIGDSFIHHHKDIVWPGDYTLSVVCSNEVGNKSANQNTVTFQREIVNVHIGQLNHTYEQGTDAKLWLEYEDGSHIYIDLHYGDGQDETFLEYFGSPSDNYMPVAHNRIDRKHTYMEGNYTARWTVYNNVSVITLTASDFFIIQYKIENVNASLYQYGRKKVTSRLEMIYPSSMGSICIDANLDHTNGPTDAFCEFNIPDGIMQKTLFAGELRNKTTFCMQYEFPFNSLGTRDMIYNCWNYIQFVSGRLRLIIIERLDNVILSTKLTSTIIPCFYNVSQMVTFSLHVNNGSDFNYTLSSGEDGRGVRHDNILSYRFEPYSTSHSLTYTKPGRFIPIIFLRNDVSNFTCSLTEPQEPHCEYITIEYPVPQLNISIENQFPDEHDITVQYPPALRLKIERTEHISNPNIKIAVKNYEETMAAEDIEGSSGSFLHDFILPKNKEFLGKQELVVNIFNNVSSQVYKLGLLVQESIADVAIVSSDNCYAVGERLVVMVNVSQGTQITYNISFDTDVTQTYTIDPLTTILHHFFNHTYTSEGNHTVTVVASNPVSTKSKSVEFCVMQTLVGTTFMALNNTVLSDENTPAIIDYRLCYPDTLAKPCHVFITWSTGDGSSPEVIYIEKLCTPPEFCWYKTVTLTDFKYGTLNTTVELRNAISNYSLWDTVDVYQEIKGVNITIGKGVYVTRDNLVVAAGKYFNFTCKIGKGSDIYIQADFGDGHVSELVFKPGFQLLTMETFSHVYSTNGTFILKCNFTSIVDSNIAEVMILSAWPVIASAINVELPTVIANPPGTMTFSLDYSLPELPTAYLTIICGGLETDKIYVDSWPQHIEFDINTMTLTPHLASNNQFRMIGDINITLQIENDVSGINYTIPIHIEEKIGNVSLVCPPNSTSDSKQISISTNTLEQFELRKEEGTSSNIKIHFGDESSEETFNWDKLNEDIMTLNHSYIEDGNYTVYVLVYNEVSNASASCEVSAYDPVLELAITPDQSQIMVNNTIDFNITTPDGIKPPSRAHYKLYVNDTNPAEGEFSRNGVIVKHWFPEVGDYRVTVKVWNGYNEKSTSMMISVVPNCRNLTSFNVTKSVQANKTSTFNVSLNGPANELCLSYVFEQEDGYAYKYWRGDHNICSVLIDFIEDYYKNITKGDTVVQLEIKLPEVTTVTISLTLTTSCYVLLMAKTINVTLPVKLPCQTLEYITDITRVKGSTANLPKVFMRKETKEITEGFLDLSIDCISPKQNCTAYIIDNASEMSRDTSITLYFAETEARYFIEGTQFEYANYAMNCMGIMSEHQRSPTRIFYFKIIRSIMTATINNNAVLIIKGIADEIVLSLDVLDPDEEKTPERFEWFCWRKGQERKNDTIIYPKIDTSVPPGTGGCFGDQSGKLDGASGSTLILYPNTQAVGTYSIRGTVIKTPRNAFDEVEVEVREASQLQVIIDIKWTAGMESSKQLKPNTTSVVCASCINCTASDIYHWVVSSGDVSDAPDSLIPFPSTAFTVSGNCISVNAAYVQAFRQFTFLCTITTQNSQGTGSAKTCSADVPTIGSFSIYPPEGESLKTEFEFKISDSGWSVKKGVGCEFEDAKESDVELSFFEKRGEMASNLTRRFRLTEQAENDDNMPLVYLRYGLKSTQIFVESDIVKVMVTAPSLEDIDSADKTVTTSSQRLALMSSISTPSPVTSVTPGAPGSSADQGIESQAEIPTAMEAEKMERTKNLQLRLAFDLAKTSKDSQVMVKVSELLPPDPPLQLVDTLLVNAQPAEKETIATNVIEKMTVDVEETPEESVVEDPDAVPVDEVAEEEEQKKKRELGKKMADTVIGALKSMTGPLTENLTLGETTQVGTPALKLTVTKQTIGKLLGMKIDNVEMVNATSSKLNNKRRKKRTAQATDDDNPNDVVDISVMYSEKNLFSYDVSASQVTSGITRVDVSGSYQHLDNDMSIAMSMDQGADNFVDMENVTTDPLTRVFSLHYNIESSQTGAFILDLQLGPSNKGQPVCIDVYISFATSETSNNQPNSTHYDFHMTLPHSQECNRTEAATKNRRLNTSPETDWTLVVPEKYLGPPGFTIAFATRVRDDPKPLNKTPSDMKIRNAITRCRSWNNLDEEWTTESCTVGEDSTLYSTKCKCSKLTEDVNTFSGGITLPTVNTIDFSNIFANFLSLLNANPTVMATLLTIICIYILVLVWARRKDIQDIERWGVTPLIDNLQGSDHFFKMSVYTGLRQQAGTKSKICFIVSGDSGDTGVRVLDDGQGKHFHRGALRHFVLSTNTSLGPLNFIRVWHDNSGSGSYASWFLDKIIIEDLQTKTRYLFLCGRWLAVDEDDGQVDRSIPVASEEEVDGFEHLFFSTARKNLTDEHLWISVLSRPTKSHFSRSQRLTCCLTLLFTTMLASAMFYQGTPEQQSNKEGDQVVRLGPIILSVQTILISIYANLIVIPINLIIVQFFRKSKPKFYIDKNKPERLAGNNESKRELYTISGTSTPEPPEKRDGKNKDQKEGDRDNKNKDKKREIIKKSSRYPLPWWCYIVAWVLAGLSCAVSMFIVFMYSLEWGKFVSEEWLSSLVFSFVQSVIVIQPLKVVAVAMLVSLIFKKYSGEDEDEEDEANKTKLASDEELVTAPDIDLNQLTAPPAPSTAALIEARAKAAADKKMWDTIKEVFMYLVFLLLVAFIAWGPRNTAMFDINKNIRNYMAGTDKLYAPNNNETIGFLGDHFRFWLWVNTTVVDMLFNTVHYNGQPTTRRDRLFMRDGVSFRVGPVRMRQLRVPPAQCELTKEMHGILTECNIGYEIHKEEDRNYTAGWWLVGPNSTEPEPGSINLAFKYHSMFELHSFPLFGKLAIYGGGGYMADLSTSPRRARKVISQLMEANWIDYYTRAVIVEFTIHNPNVNLFAHTSYIIEFPPTGSALATPKIAVFQIYSGVGSMGTAVLFAQIIYIFVIIYFMVRAIKEVRKVGSKVYFAEPWNIYEVIVIVSSIVCIAMFAMKEALGRLVTKELSEQSDYGSYLQLATYIELVDYTVGFIVFMANIKFLRLLRFNDHVQELGSTFRRAGQELIYFGITFFIVFTSFSLSAMELFSSKLFDFHNFIDTMQSLYGIILGRVTFVAMHEAQPILGPLFFLIFLMAVYFILVNMFVTILTSAYTEVRLSNMKNENDAVISRLLSRMKSGLGLQKTKRDMGAGYVENTDLLDKRLDLINTWINEYCKDEAILKNAAMGKTDTHQKSRLQPAEKKSNISRKFTF